MLTLFAGLLFAFLLWQGAVVFKNSDPKKLAVFFKKAGAVAAFIAAGIFVLRSRIDMAVLLGFLGASLWGWSQTGRLSLFGRTFFQKGSYEYRTISIAFMLDQQGRPVEGTILKGAFATRSLASLSMADYERLGQECALIDPEGLILLEAYLDRLFPGWRKTDQADSNTRTDSFSQRGAMTKQEAYEILGLEAGAGPDEIRRAHRALMKKLHPDQGGTTYLATRINQAKDMLLSGKG